jgi:uncharacterized protein YerC
MSARSARRFWRCAAWTSVAASLVELLERGLPYREIHKQTGVSVTTIGRVARYLTSGNGGYRAVSDRLNANP